jgi:hypothetical protein
LSIYFRSTTLGNPFYPKDPNASFGKQVLTPTLALTSFAATTPEHREVRYWDENLLDGSGICSSSIIWFTPSGSRWSN